VLTYVGDRCIEVASNECDLAQANHRGNCKRPAPKEKTSLFSLWLTSRR
jgi:hypothetical protein